MLRQLFIWILTLCLVVFKTTVAETQNVDPGLHKLSLDEVFGLADRLMTENKLSDARLLLESALSSLPDDPTLLNLYGVTLFRQFEFQMALLVYQRLTELMPDDDNVYYNVGLTLMRLEDYVGAVNAFNQCLRRNRSNARAYMNIGVAAESVHDRETALRAYRLAIQHMPVYPLANKNLGILLWHKVNKTRDEELEAAMYFVRGIGQELGLNVEPPLSVAKLLAGEEFGFDWRDLHVYNWCMRELAKRDLHVRSIFDPPPKNVQILNNLPVVQAFFALSQDLPSSAMAGLARLQGQYLDRVMVEERRRFFAEMGSPNIAQPPEGIRAADYGFGLNLATFHTYDSSNVLIDGVRRLRIGYISFDFRQHPTCFQVRELTEAHDHNAVEVFVFSTCPKRDHNDCTEAIRNASDEFVDLSKMSDYDAAKEIRSRQIDVLIDLQGHTGSHRMEILALRPAPVQAHIAAYAGSLSAPFIDYYIADELMVPKEEAAHFGEMLAYTPFSGYINSRQPLSEGLGVREELSRPWNGLPTYEGAFVIACFSNVLKYDPVTFTSWMQLLERNPDTYFWMNPPKNTREAILTEAKARGIDPRRFVFSRRVESNQDHVTRLALADLALDTFVYNGHITALDVLYAGTPLITLPGANLARRVAAGLSVAMGMPDLVVHSHKEYYDRAVSLMDNREELHQLREKQQHMRFTTPLCNISLTARNLENLYRRMRAVTIPNV
eukprot:Rmarinus@m.10971